MRKTTLAIAAAALFVSTASWACPPRGCADTGASASAHGNINVSVGGAGVAGARIDVSASGFANGNRLVTNQPKVRLEGVTGNEIHGLGYVYASGPGADASANLFANSNAKLRLNGDRRKDCEVARAGLRLESSLYGERHLAVSGDNSGDLLGGGRYFDGYANTYGKAVARTPNGVAEARVILDAEVATYRGRVNVQGAEWTNPDVGGNRLGGDASGRGWAYARTPQGRDYEAPTPTVAP